MRRSEQTLPVTLDLQDERASAYGHSIVFMRQAYPNMALMTYDDTCHRGAEQLLLVKLVVGIGKEHRILSYESCEESTTADNIEGGLQSHALSDGNRVVSEIYPLILPEKDAVRGGAVLHIHSEKPGIFLRFGSGGVAFMHFSPNQHMRGEDIDCEAGEAVLSEDGHLVTIRHDGRTAITCVRGNMTFSICPKSTGGSYAEGFTEGTDARLLIGFSADEQEAQSLSALDPAEEIRKISDYYREKFANLYIHTPSPHVDEAFRHAYLNLEYAWLYPFGWIESIQHWPTMWHMEQTAAEEWGGHADRARRTLLTQAEYLFDSGAVPDMCTNHQGRRDWGGNNQFFFREVLHYLEMTDDRDFAEKLEPVMEKILRQTFREYDPTESFVLSWHSQIGNQEDFESTPGRGAAPGSEGAQMLFLLSRFYAYLGQKDKAIRYAQLSCHCLEQVKKTVWKRDLGRMAWFMDDYGETRLDTTYHGICYPIIYNQVDSFDGMSSIDHLLHRMSGPEGEIYQSNHFGSHAYEGVPTWGMQCGSDMQPFATAAYARLGMGEEAVRPLQFVADRVCGPYQRGAFPETANEKRFAYFSPSAGVYAQSVIESLFGLKMDRMTRTLTVSPCFPDAWDHAELCLPSVHMDYTHPNRQTTCIRLESPDGLSKKLLLRMKPAGQVRVTVNGQPISCEITDQCGFSEVTADLGSDAELTVTVSCVPFEYRVQYSPCIACGEKLSVQVENAEFLGFADRCGILDGNGCIRRDLLDEYRPFGDFGLVNFARHSIGCRIRQGNRELVVPCHLTVVPPQRIRAVYNDSRRTVSLTYTNQTGHTVDTDTVFLSGHALINGHLFCPPHETVQLEWPFDAPVVSGFNRAFLMAGDDFNGEIRLESPLPADPARLTVLPLPEAQTVPYEAWKKRAMPPHHGAVLQGADAFLNGVDPVINMRGISFPQNGTFLPVSMDRPAERVAQVPLGVRARKVYLLFCPFAANHEMNTRLFDAEILCEKEDAYRQPLFRRPLTMPGELEYGFGNAVVAGFSTYSESVPRPSVCPPLVNGDYADTVCPVYPRQELFCRHIVRESGHAVFTLLEFDLGEERSLRELRIVARASDAAGGIFGIACESCPE